MLVLCHESPSVVARRLSSSFFTHPDIAIYVHYDGARSKAQRAELTRLLAGQRNVRFVEEPVACKWGEHSLVEATRRLMALALDDATFGSTHLVLLSTSCVPYRPVSSLQRFLAERPGMEFIQAQDVGQQRWIKDGLEQERYGYYFPFNYRTQKWWFEWATARQREFGIRRKVPQGLSVHFGSQWFCLTRDTAAAVSQELALPAIQRWLKWSWIPDEFAIQTLVRKVCPPSSIAGFNLTYYEFDDKGLPLVLDNGHFEHLMRQPFFFARKVAPEALRLEAEIGEHVVAEETDFGYFERVGRPTSHFVRFLAQMTTGTSAQAHVGTVVDGWRGPMETNQRRYYVLHAASRAWLLALIRTTAQNAALPIFELPFDTSLPPVAPGAQRLGFRSLDAGRRDHDAQSFMFELVNAHPTQPCAFGLEIGRPGKVRDFVRWDRPAVVIDCNPPLSREQRAAAMLESLQVAGDAPVIQAVLEAMRSGGELPDEGYLSDIKESAACQTAILRELGPALGDQTLLSLRTAYHSLDPTPYHPEAGAAWRQFWK